eukprot:12588308-Alexandrium_andersonii.AAC.1
MSFMLTIGSLAALAQSTSLHSAASLPYWAHTLLFLVLWHLELIVLRHVSALLGVFARIFWSGAQ